MAVLVSSNTEAVSECMEKTEETNRSIFTAFNLAKYTGYFDFMTYANIVMIKLQAQGAACGIQTYLSMLDNSFSQLPQSLGSLSNVIVQVVYWYMTGASDDF